MEKWKEGKGNFADAIFMDLSKNKPTVAKNGHKQ